jgi:hypothetical protein
MTSVLAMTAMIPVLFECPAIFKKLAIVAKPMIGRPRIAKVPVSVPQSASPFSPVPHFSGEEWQYEQRASSEGDKCS